MESSSEQALLIGVNILILIIALTSAIMLMTTVLDMSELANTTIKTKVDSTLMNLYGNTTERIYTGEQVLAIIEEYFSPTTNIDEKYILMVNGTSVAGTEGTKEITFTKDMLDNTYHLKYIGKDSDQQKGIYNFEKI